MAREKMFDPAFQKSFTEAILKENKIRIQWYSDHGARFRFGVDSCSWDDEPDDDDEDFAVETVAAKSSEPSETRKETDDVEKIKEQLGKDILEKKVKLPAVMKPVPVPVKRLLYQGLSHHEEGRHKYLQARYKEDPEEKFFYPLCSSWEYGWTYGQDHEPKNPEYGSRQIMKFSFFRPNDPQLKPRD